MADERRTLKLIPCYRTYRKVVRPCTGRPANYLTDERVCGRGAARYPRSSKTGWPDLLWRRSIKRSTRVPRWYAWPCWNLMTIRSAI